MGAWNGSVEIFPTGIAKCWDCGERLAYWESADELSEWITDHNERAYEPTCPACGDVIEYCPGHGEMGDPLGYAILQDHDAGRHDGCDIGSDCLLT